MIAVICLLAFLTVGSCSEQLPTRGEIESSINRTIEEVERMVRDDPSLPRLSRSQIVDILFNITSMDMNYYEKSVERTREDYQRALMIVMPHSSKNSTGDSLQELYTKAPVVEVIKDAPEELDGAMEHRKHYGNHRETFAEVGPGTQETLRSISSRVKSTEPAPEKFSFNLEGLGSVDEAGGAFGRPRSKNPPAEVASPTRKTNLEIIYSTSVTQKPTTKLPTSPDKADSGFRPTMPSTRSTQNVLTSDQWRYNAPPSSGARPARPSGGSRSRQGSTPAPFLPTMMTETSTEVTLPSSNVQASKSTVAPQGRGNAPPHRGMEEPRILNAKPASLYVTPMSSTTSTQTHSPSTTPGEPETTKTPMPMREEVQDLLASIGLRPETVGNDDKSGNKIDHQEDKLFGANFQIPESTNAILAPTSGLTSIGDDSPSIIGQNTFQRTPQEVEKGVNNLSPDVQLLFQRFGLQSTKDRETDSEVVTTEKPRVHTTKTSFWNNFKPIPTSRVKDQGMRDFLAKFGLGIENDRREKSVMTRQRKGERKPSLIEAVPGNMKGILENIGLITGSHRQPPTSATTRSPELHVFKPHETSIDNEKQREKINHLLDTVKMVQDGKADVSAVQTAAKELLESTKKLKNGPDPLSIEEILRIYNDDIKNEIKRQQDPKDLEDLAISGIEETENSTSTTSPEVEMSSNDTSAIATDSSGSSSDASATSTESSIDLKDLEGLTDFGTTENTNLDSLADSFGGSTAAPDPVLPTPRKTGLYFLVDWNTFLEVGEEGKDRVNLRFQPKAGDRTRFLPVTVP